MDKLIVISVIVASILIPAIGARDPSPRRGLRKTVVWMGIFILVYFLAVLFVMPRLMS
jgi:hypothetical protein